MPNCRLSRACCIIEVWYLSLTLAGLIWLIIKWCICLRGRLADKTALWSGRCPHQETRTVTTVPLRPITHLLHNCGSGMSIHAQTSPIIAFVSPVRGFKTWHLKTTQISNLHCLAKLFIPPKHSKFTYFHKLQCILLGLCDELMLKKCIIAKESKSYAWI